MIARLLTDRQLELLRLLCAGTDRRDVAAALGIDKRTVANHAFNIRMRAKMLSIADICAAIAADVGRIARSEESDGAVVIEGGKRVGAE